MMRQPLIRRAAKGLQRALSDFLNAPVGGWNARDPLELMKPTDAVVLENWFPRQSALESRGGNSPHVTGFAGDIARTLMAWNGNSPKLFAATQTAIYDVTVAGVRGSSMTSLTQGKLSWTNFTVAGGQYLVAVNGVDKLKLYNGTAWLTIDGASTPAITGLATTSLSSVAVAHRRLWFTAVASSSAWYLPVAQIGGALTEFPLGQVFTQGGNLVAINTWSTDAGDGRDDFTVFVSSQGELAVYRGSDPSTASGFEKVGVYRAAQPVGGYNCLHKYGGDLLYLCELGLFQVSKLLSAPDTGGLAISDKISQAFTTAIQAYAGNSNWQLITYQSEQALLVNIPVTSEYSEQYVMNTLTGAWARFTGWPSAAFAVLSGRLFAAFETAIQQVWTEGDDDGSIIRCRAQSAYSAFGRRGKLKHLKLVSPIVETAGELLTYVAVDADYQMRNVVTVVSSGSTSSSSWDTALWDDAVWGGDYTVGSGWHTVRTAEAYSYAMIFIADAGQAKAKLIGFRLLGEIGGALG
jgi:hypothetical protein